MADGRGGAACAGDGWGVSAATPEPPPQAGKRDIADLVMTDIQARVAAGLEKYGTKLQSFNGRDALMDAYQEAIDLVMYLRQAMAERDECKAPEHPDMQCGSCGDKLVWFAGSYSHDDRFALENSPRHEHVAWGIKEWASR